MLFGQSPVYMNVCKEHESRLGTDASGEAIGQTRLRLFDEYLRCELGIESQYLRHYVAILLIQGAGNEVLNKDLSFAFSASRLINDHIWGLFIRFNHAIETTTPRCSGISSLMPYITYDAHNQAVTLEFDDIFSIVDDTGRTMPFCFANYAITVFADHSRPPEFGPIRLSVYRNLEVNIAGQRIRPSEILCSAAPISAQALIAHASHDPSSPFHHSCSDGQDGSSLLLALTSV